MIRLCHLLILLLLMLFRAILLQVEQSVGAMRGVPTAAIGGFRRGDGVRITSLLVLHVFPLLVERCDAIIILILLIAPVLLVCLLGHPGETRQVVLLEHLDTAAELGVIAILIIISVLAVP